MKNAVTIACVLDILASICYVVSDIKSEIHGYHLWPISANISIAGLLFAVSALRSLSSSDSFPVVRYSVYKQIELIAKAANFFILFIVFNPVKIVGFLLIAVGNLLCNTGLTLVVWSYNVRMLQNVDLMQQYLRLASVTKSGEMKVEFEFGTGSNG